MKGCHRRGSHDPNREIVCLDPGQPAGVAVLRDFERILAAFGFALIRTTGSHRQYRHPQVPRILSIQPRGKEAKSYQIEQFVDMVEEFGLEMDG